MHLPARVFSGCRRNPCSSIQVWIMASAASASCRVWHSTTSRVARGDRTPRRSQVGSRTGAPTVGSGGNSPIFTEGLSPAPLVTIPVPATSNPACRFPAPGFPVDFTTRVMGPIGLGALSTHEGQPDSQKTDQVADTTNAYSTSSNQNPDACARASNGA